MLEQAETHVLAGPIGENERPVLTLLERARTQFRSLDDPALTAYWLARAALIEGMLYNQQEDERRATAVLEEGLELSQRSLSAGAFSEGLRVRADLHSQMMLARGFVYMVRNGGDTRDAASRIFGFSVGRSRL